MCNYCYVETEGVEAGLGKTITLAEMDFGKNINTTVEMYVSEDCHEIDLCKNISEDGNYWIELPGQTVSVNINYCPFCGRKLI